MDGFADDILLLNLIKRGDKSAFKHLFETYFTPLCRFMYIYVHNKEVAEELALDVFLYVWEHRDTLQINLSFKAYLFKSAHNRCLNVLRQKGDVLYLEDVGDVAVDSALLNKENTEELQRLIREAVLALPEKCKEIFYLSRFKNLSNKEIAEKLKISVKTVEAQITKALKRIKEFLGETYYYLF